MSIVGVSFDDPATNLDWATEEGFQFELWSDDDAHTLAVTYGAATANSLFANRVTVILDAEGTWKVVYNPANALSGPQDTLDDCTLLFGTP